MRLPCSVSVQCHPGVCWLCRLPGCGVCACVCVTDECESVSESTRRLKRAMWLPVVSWRALLWWKVICFPEERPVPSFLPLLRHRPSNPPNTLGTLLITLIALTVQWRRTEHSSAVFYVFYQLCTLFVCLHARVVRVQSCCVWFLLKINYEDDSVSVALNPNSIHTPSAV